MNNSIIANVADIATAVSAMMVFVAAYSSSKQFKRNLDFSRAQRIREFYTDYMKEAVGHAKFWNEFWANKESHDEEDVEDYHGYVAYMLTVLEEVLVLEDYQESEAPEHRADWVESVIQDLKHHVHYFEDPAFTPEIRRCYSPRLLAAIDEAIKRYGAGRSTDSSIASVE